MNTQNPLSVRRRFLILGGLAAGFANGLLGAGGGIIIVWTLTKALEGAVKDSKDIFANALAVMLPVSAMSAISYATHGSLPTDGILRFILPAVLGGVTGAFLLDRISADAVKILFGFLVILSGIIMVIGR